MALNNQTAILKVVDNRVYFTVNAVPSTQTNLRGDLVTAFSYATRPNVLPVGLIMNVTPQISDNDVITLNVRPTISRIIGFKDDPNPDLARAGVVSQVPEIQVREIESILKINDKDVAIIGGLMQDNSEQKKTGVPVLSELPLVGDLFSYRDENYAKTELVIFLRPIVVKEASLSGDLKDYKAYLPNPSQPDRQAPTGLTQP
jgi:general secretion pathway protein D